MLHFKSCVSFVFIDDTFCEYPSATTTIWTSNVFRFTRIAAEMFGFKFETGEIKSKEVTPTKRDCFEDRMDQSLVRGSRGDHWMHDEVDREGRIPFKSHCM